MLEMAGVAFQCDIRIDRTKLRYDTCHFHAERIHGHF